VRGNLWLGDAWLGKGGFERKEELEFVVEMK
jgi:hypothetical protein